MHTVIEPTISIKPIYVFDLDGTLSNTEKRVKYLEQKPKDWDTFYAESINDDSIESIASILRELSVNNDIYVVTGRRVSEATNTLHWFSKHNLKVDALYMRPNGDHTADDVMKESWLTSRPEETRSRIVAVFEDRKRVVDMWRRNKVTCLQVADGNF